MYLIKTFFFFLALVLEVIAFSGDIRGEDVSSQVGKNRGAEVPAAPEDGGPRNWQVTGVSSVLNLREQPSTKAKIISSYMPGTSLNNLGCLHAEDRVWCDVQQLGGGRRGFVVADYLKPAVSPDGSV